MTRHTNQHVAVSSTTSSRAAKNLLIFSFPCYIGGRYAIYEEKIYEEIDGGKYFI
jgi:glucose-6-phosphate isomerase